MSNLYKADQEDLYLPDKYKLFFDSSEYDSDKEAVYKSFLENLELYRTCLNKSLNYDQIHSIFKTFLMFVYYFPKNIKDYFQDDLCLSISSFINKNLIPKYLIIIKDAMNIIAYICYFDTNYIQFFSDNNIVNIAIEAFLENTHELFSSVTFLFDTLLVSNTSQTIYQICELIFPAANDYCFALQRGIDKEGENIRIATSFFYFLAEYPQNLDQEKINRIFDVVKFQIKWNENPKTPIPNDIFIFTLWTYESLLKNYRTNTKLFITEEMILSLSRLLEDNFDEKNEEEEEKDEAHNYYSDVEKNPLKPLLAIYKLIFTSQSDFNGLFKMIVETTSFPRIIELTNSPQLTIALESFGILNTIIIHHTDLIGTLIEFDLIPCLQNAFEQSFAIKTSAYYCIIDLLLCGIRDVVFNVLTNKVFLLAIEYISMTSENDRKKFFEVFLRILRFIIKCSLIDQVRDSFAQNGIYEILDQVYENIPENITNEVCSILTPEE